MLRATVSTVLAMLKFASPETMNGRGGVFECFLSPLSGGQVEKINVVYKTPTVINTLQYTSCLPIL